MTSGVLAPVSGNASRLRFSHELVREALEDELQAGERVRRHRAVAEALERFYGSRLERHLAEIAYHFASAGHDPRTVGFARRAAESSARQLAFEEAARLYELALRAADANGIAEPGDRAALLLALGDAWARAGQSSNAKSAFVEAADVGRAGDLRDVVVMRRARVRIVGPHAVGTCGDGPAARPAPGGRAARRGRGRQRPARPGARADRDRGARGRRRASCACERGGGGDGAPDRRPRVLAYALTAKALAVWRPQTIEAGGCLADEVIALSRATGDLEQEFAGHEHAVEATWTVGDLAAVRSHLDAMRRIEPSLGQPSQRWAVTSWGVLLAIYDGRFDEASAGVEAAFAIGAHSLPWNATAMHRLQTFTLLDVQDRLEGVPRLGETVRRGVSGLSDLRGRARVRRRSAGRPRGRASGDVAPGPRGVRPGRSRRDAARGDDAARLGRGGARCRGRGRRDLRRAPAARGARRGGPAGALPGRGRRVRSAGSPRDWGDGTTRSATTRTRSS